MLILILMMKKEYMVEDNRLSMRLGHNGISGCLCVTMWFVIYRTQLIIIHVTSTPW